VLSAARHPQRIRGSRDVVTVLPELDAQPLSRVIVLELERSRSCCVRMRREPAHAKIVDLKTEVSHSSAYWRK